MSIYLWSAWFRGFTKCVKIFVLNLLNFCIINYAKPVFLFLPNFSKNISFGKVAALFSKIVPQSCLWGKISDFWKLEAVSPYLENYWQDILRTYRARGGGGGLLPYIGYMGMCRGRGYGFQAIWSGKGSSNYRIRKLIQYRVPFLTGSLSGHKL